MTNLQIEYLHLAFNTNMTKTDISKKLGISRSTIYRWKNEDENFIKEYQKMKNRNIENIEGVFNENLQLVTDELLNIITKDDTSDSDRLNAIKFWMDRVLGKPVSSHQIKNSIEVEKKQDELKIEEEDILSAFDRLKESKEQD